MSGAKAAFSRNFEDAAREYTQALETASAPQHAPLSASLYADRAATWLRLKDFDATIKDCAVAIYAHDGTQVVRAHAFQRAATTRQAGYVDYMAAWRHKSIFAENCSLEHASTQRHWRPGSAQRTPRKVSRRCRPQQAVHRFEGRGFGLGSGELHPHARGGEHLNLEVGLLSVLDAARAKQQGPVRQSRQTNLD